MTFCMHVQKACINSPQQARPYANLAIRLETRFSFIHLFNHPSRLQHGVFQTIFSHKAF